MANHYPAHQNLKNIFEMLKTKAATLLDTVEELKSLESSHDGGKQALIAGILAFQESVSQEKLQSIEMATSDQVYLSRDKSCSSATIILQTLTRLDNGDALIQQLTQLLVDPSESTQLANLISQYLCAHKVRPIFQMMLKALEDIKSATKTLLNDLSDSEKEKLCTQIIETYQLTSLIISLPQSLINRDKPNLSAPLYIADSQQDISEKINPVLKKVYTALIKLQSDHKVVHKEYWFIELFCISLMPYQSSDELREKSASIINLIQSFWEKNEADKKIREISASKEDLATIQQILAKSIPPTQPDPGHPFLGGDSPVIVPGEAFICPRMSQQLRLLTTSDPRDRIIEVREHTRKLARKLTEILNNEKKQCHEYYEKVKEQDLTVHHQTMIRQEREQAALSVNYEAAIKKINDDLEKDVTEEINTQDTNLQSGLAVERRQRPYIRMNILNNKKYDIKIKEAQKTFDQKAEEIKTSIRNQKSAYKKIQERTQKCQKRDNNIFEILLSAVSTNSLIQIESENKETYEETFEKLPSAITSLTQDCEAPKLAQLETTQPTQVSDCLLEKHAISNCKKMNQALFISDALNELKETITKYVVSSVDALDVIRKSSCNPLWEALCALVEWNFSATRSSEAFNLLKTICIAPVIAEHRPDKDSSSTPVEDYLKIFAVLIIRQHHDKSRELESLNSAYSKSITVEKLKENLESMFTDMKKNGQQKEIAICGHASCYLYNHARNAMKSEIKRLIPLATDHIDIPSTEDIKQTANQVVFGSITQAVHDNDTEIEICQKFTNALNQYTESDTSITAIHKFPFASRLIIQAENAQSHINELKNIESYDEILESLERQEKEIKLSAVKSTHNHYPEYQSMLKHYHGDMTFFLNSKAVGQTRETQEKIKKYAGRITVSHRNQPVPLASLFESSNEPVTKAKLEKYNHCPDLKKIIASYRSIINDKPSKSLINKVNKYYPSIAWELLTMKQNMDHHFSFLHDLIISAPHSSVEIWAFMTQIEQLQIRYKAMLIEIKPFESKDGYDIDINLINLLRDLHTRLSKALLPLIEHRKKVYQSQTSIDFVWETLYKNLHKQLLPNTNQTLTNFHGFYEKTIVDQTEEITEIQKLYKIIVTELDKITNTTSSIDNFSSSLDSEKVLLKTFSDKLTRFIEIMMETSFSEQSKIDAFFNMKGMSLLTYWRSTEPTEAFNTFIKNTIMIDQSPAKWFFNVCFTEQLLLAKKHMHARLSSLCRSKMIRGSAAIQKVSMSLQFSEDKNLVVHFSENLDRLLTVKETPLTIELGDPDEKNEKIEQIQTLENQRQIIFSTNSVATMTDENQMITEDCSSYIEELVKSIPSDMILHFPKTLPMIVVKRILEEAKKTPKEKMSLSLDNPCTEVEQMMIQVCDHKPDHYKVFYKDSVFEPLFDNRNFQEVMLVNIQNLAAGKTEWKYLSVANRLYSFIDVIIFMICKDINTIYDTTEDNTRYTACEIPKEYEEIARLFYRSLFEQSPKDHSEMIMQFTRAIEYAVGSMSYKNEPSTIDSKDILFFPQGNDGGIDIIPKDVLVKARSTLSPEQNQIKLATRPHEATGDYPIEAYKVNSDSVTNPFTRVEISPFHTGLFKEEPKYHLFYQGLRTGPAADNLIGNRINTAWHTANMTQCLTSEGSHNEHIIRKLKELSYFGTKLSKMKRYDYTLTISKMRELANEIMSNTGRKCPSFFMWPFFESLSEDIQLTAYRQMRSIINDLSGNTDNASQIKYATHLIHGWGCKANIVEALKILTSILKLTSDPAVQAKIKTIIFSTLFFRLIVCEEKNDGMKQLSVNSAIYNIYHTAQMQSDTEKLNDISVDLNQYGCLDYNESNLKSMFDDGEHSAGLLLAQIYLAGSFKNASGELIHSNPTNLESAISMLGTILETDGNNHVANLLLGIALRTGKGTHMQPLRSQQHLNKIPAELPTPIECMLHQNLTTWRLGVLDYHLVNSAPVTRQNLTDEIVEDVLKNQRHLYLEVENELSLESRSFEEEAFNNVLQVGVLLNLNMSKASLILQEKRNKNDRAEKLLTEKYDQIMKNAWDILTRDGERFLLLLKHEPFEERLRQTIYTESKEIRLTSNPKR